MKYLAAVNAGSPRAADAFDFDSGADGWYSVTSPAGAPPAASVTARDREALRRYLAARHPQRERLVLKELRIEEDDGLGQIEYRLTRRADDIKTSRVEGKGALDCTTRKLLTWSMSSVEPGEETGRLCPRGRRADIVACARRAGPRP